MNYGSLAVILVIAAIVVVAVWQLSKRKRSKPEPQEHRPHSPDPAYDKSAIARSVAEGQSPGGDRSY